MENTQTYKLQQCQDDSLNQSFHKLHEDLVNKIIFWCNTNNVEIDDFYLSGDGLIDSIKYGKWSPSTDSSLTFNKYDDEYKKVFMKYDRDYINSLSQKEIKEIKNRNNKPYLLSI